MMARQSTRVLFGGCVTLSWSSRDLLNSVALSLMALPLALASGHSAGAMSDRSMAPATTETIADAATTSDSLGISSNIPALGLAIAGVDAAEPARQAFVPIAENEKPLYRFDFQRWFYTDEPARRRDLELLAEVNGRITALRQEVGNDPAKLLNALQLMEQAGVIADRLLSYGGLRFAVNTNDDTAKNEGEKAKSDSLAATAFLPIAVQSLDDARLQEFMQKEPKLATYRFQIEVWRRERPHTLAEQTEVLLKKAGPHLDPFDADFYELMLKRTADATIRVGDQDLNVTLPAQYTQLLRLEDRALREAAFKKRLTAYASQADLYAFALLQKARLANTLAEARGFSDAAEEVEFSSYLTPEAVTTVLQAFRKHASLATRFEAAEKLYQSKLLHLEPADPWDLEYRPANQPEPRFSIKEASSSVLAATKVLGPDYQKELALLLDPRKGRMDIVAGGNRQSGDFTWGFYGPSWMFYMQGYAGYLRDVVMLAHESAHVVHYRILSKANVPFVYSDGARYFTEGFAKVSELLILDELAKFSKTKEDRLFYLRELNSKLASVKFTSMYWAALATAFETDVYQRVRDDAVRIPTDIHKIWAEYGRLWSVDFDVDPVKSYDWAGTHHFFDASRYYFNYLFAWVVAVSIYERTQEDPTFATKLVSLMRAGFSDEPAKLLRQHLGIDLDDHDNLERMFALVEKRLVEFEQEIDDL
jgi:oligoendopeptidase F